MKKYYAIIVLVLTILLCGCEIQQVEKQTKPIDGQAAMFEEDFGFYSKDASVFVEGNTMHMYYTTNETKNTLGDVIAYRSATQKNGVWTFSTRKIVLIPTENTFDSAKVSNPDVIKGEFKYNEETYNYLMAYAGNDQNNDRSYQIGMAVAKTPAGPWVKLSEAVVKYDENVYGAAFGAGSPSLVSFDNKSKVYLFYTFADIDLTSTRVEMMDLADLNNIKRQTASDITVGGLEDKNLGSQAIFNNADFAINSTTNELITVRDRNPLAAAPAYADSVQVAKAPIAILVNPITNVWEIVKRSIGEDETLNPDKPELLGWQRVFGGEIVTDEYGHTLDKLQIVCSVSCIQENDTTDNSYLYTAAVILVDVE